jgi:hypothetical protein
MNGIAATEPEEELQYLPLRHTWPTIMGYVIFFAEVIIPAIARGGNKISKWEWI